MRFDSRGLRLAVGLSTGHVALYDIRRGAPLLVKDHNYGLPIVDIKWHGAGDQHVVSARHLTRSCSSFSCCCSCCSFSSSSSSCGCCEHASLASQADKKILKIWSAEPTAANRTPGESRTRNLPLPRARPAC